MSVQPSVCPFCAADGGRVLYRDVQCRAVLTDEPFPGFCRVVWNAHVREFTDLDAAARTHCMAVVGAVEEALRALLSPDKMNIASLGNTTPHLHWHVIPRFTDDSHFPQPIWGVRQRPGVTRMLPPRFFEELASRLERALRLPSVAH